MYKYYLLISFRCGDIWKTEEDVENILGPSHGSGCGFGARDLSYYFNNLNSLKSAVRKVRRMGKKIKCEAWENIDEYEQKKLSLIGIR